MIVGSRRKQRGALRTHDSAGEAPPARCLCSAASSSLTKQRATRRSERRVGPATHNVVSPVPTKCHQLSPHISCAGCAITNHSELSRMSHLRKSPLYRRQGWPSRGHNHQKPPTGAPPQHGTGSRLYRAMLTPAAAPPGRPRVFPQAEMPARRRVHTSLHSVRRSAITALHWPIQNSHLELMTFGRAFYRARAGRLAATAPDLVCCCVASTDSCDEARRRSRWRASPA